MKKYILITLCCIQIVNAFEFEGSIPGNGAIPDGPGDCGISGEPLAITFDVTAVTELNRVELTLDIQHSWVGDLIVELEAPDFTRHVIFGKTGALEGECLGDSSNLDDLYIFSDQASDYFLNNWWIVAANLSSQEVLPHANYRTTTIGGEADPGLNTSMNEVFSEVANPNGTWTLYVYDNAAVDTGHVSAAQLLINRIKGQINDGEASYNIQYDGISHRLETDVYYRAVTTWRYRLASDTREYPILYPDYAIYSDGGDAVTMTWLDVDGKGFRADLTHVIDQTGLNPDEAIITSTMKITNVTANDIDISLFNSAFFGVNHDYNEPVDDNDTAQLINNDPSHIIQVDEDDTYQAEFRATGNENYEINSGDVLADKLNDGTIDDLSNVWGDGYGPANVGTAFQWFSGPLVAGSSYQVQTTIAVGGITAPEPVAPMITSDLIFADGFN